MSEYNSIFEGKNPEYISLVFPSLPNEDQKTRMNNLWSLIRGSNPSLDSTLQNLDANPLVISTALRKAFTRLDDEIVNAPIRIFENQGNKSSGKILDANHLNPQQMKSLQALLPAMSGSCALLACFNTARRS